MRRRVRRGRRGATCGGADDMRALRVSPPKPLQRDCTIADADADADAGAGGTTLNELPACILAGAPEPPTRAGARYHRHRACASSHHSPRPIGAFHPCAPLPKPPPSPPPAPPLLPPSRAPRGRRSREARALWHGPLRWVRVRGQLNAPALFARPLPRFGWILIQVWSWDFSRLRGAFARPSALFGGGSLGGAAAAAGAASATGAAGLRSGARPAAGKEGPRGRPRRERDGVGLPVS